MDNLESMYEKVWATLDRVGERLDRVGERLDRMGEESQKSRADFDLRMKKLDARLGGMANSHGSFAEEYFFNAFDDGETNFFGLKFDDIVKNLKNRLNGLKDEYDIVMYNHDSVALIEVKYKAHENDIPTVLKKAETFKELFPYYKDFKVYLGFASMSFYPELEDACTENGIAIIKQVGDKVIINDKHIKAF